MRALYIYNNDYGYTDKQYENNLGHKKYINKNQQLCVMWRQMDITRSTLKANLRDDVVELFPNIL